LGSRWLRIFLLPSHLDLFVRSPPVVFPLAVCATLSFFSPYLPFYWLPRFAMGPLLYFQVASTSLRLFQYGIELPHVILSPASAAPLFPLVVLRSDRARFGQTQPHVAYDSFVQLNHLKFRFFLLLLSVFVTLPSSTAPRVFHTFNPFPFPDKTPFFPHLASPLIHVSSNCSSPPLNLKHFSPCFCLPFPTRTPLERSPPMIFRYS